MRLPSSSSTALIFVAVAAATVGPRVAGAQPYARFAVPDSALARAVAASRADFETAWNALLVNEIRAHAAGTDSAKRLARLARNVAAAEPRALGSSIGADALALRRRWKKEQLHARVGAAVAESLAAVARGRRDFDVADSLLQRARGAYHALGEKRREAWTLGALGANALVAGRNHEAAAYYEIALAARRTLGDSLLVGNTLNDLGQTWYLLSRPADAHAALAQAAAIREAQGRWNQLGNTLNFLGLTHAALGHPDSAITCLRRAVELSSAQGDSARTLVALRNFALQLIHQGRTTEARAVSDRALVIARASSSALDIADIETNLGVLERTAGHYGLALSHIERAIAGYEAWGDPARIADALGKKASTLVALGDAAGARTLLERARALADSARDGAVTARILSVQAFAAKEMGDAEGARRLAGQGYDAALAVADTAGIHDATSLLGYLSAERGDAATAERWYARAAAAGVGMRPEIRASDLTSLAMARQMLGNLADAERLHREALRIAAENHVPTQAMWALCNLGDLAERRGDYPTAFASYRGALEIADTLRTLQSADRQSISLFANRLFMFEAMIHLLGKLDPLHPDSGYAESAFEWAEKSRARAFLDLVTSAGRDAGRSPIVTLAESRALLRSDREAILEYSVGDSSTSLWVVRRDRWRRFTLPARAALRSRVQTLRRSLSDPAASTGAAGRRAARGLYETLVAPAESLLAGVDHLIVAPDGMLSLIPFEALLVREAPGEAAPPRGAYLGERFVVSYTPSVSVLATRRAGSSDSSIVAIGHPDFGTASAPPGAAADGGNPGVIRLADLPSTEDEIATLRRLAGRNRIVTLTRRDATRAGVLGLPELATAGVVHVATHGDVNESEPERSGLWLAADSSGAPTRIEVRDIMGLSLSAGLVTLSACETGLGRLENGEGVVGLTRAFMAAGAQSVLVSLWPVNDRSTSRLMAAFYRRALDGRTSRAAALAAAKRAMLADPETRAPFYWAPFILVGASGTP